jgi:hypothetical protein
MRVAWVLLALAACTNEPVRVEDPDRQQQRYEDQERQSGGGRGGDDAQRADWYDGGQPTNTPSPATPGTEYGPEPHDDQTADQPMPRSGD